MKYLKEAMAMSELVKCTKCNSEPRIIGYGGDDVIVNGRHFVLDGQGKFYICDTCGGVIFSGVSGTVSVWEIQ